MVVVADDADVELWGICLIGGESKHAKISVVRKKVPHLH